MSDDNARQNTDRELWREREGDFYADSIHVTQDGRIGINCGGTVFVMPVRKWHEAAIDAARGETGCCATRPSPDAEREKLGAWLQDACQMGDVVFSDLGWERLRRIAAILRGERNE